MKGSSFSIRQALVYGLQATFDNFGTVLGVLATVIFSFMGVFALFLITFLSVGFSATFSDASLSNLKEVNTLVSTLMNHWHLVVAGLFAIFVAAAIQALYTLGAIRMSLTYYDTHQLVYRELFSEWISILPFLIARLLFGIIISCGLLLFVVPGIFWAVIFSFYPQALVDKHVGPIAAFRYSMHLTRGERPKVFIWTIIEWLLTAVAVKLFFLSLIIVWPVIMFANAYIYRKLQYLTNYHEEVPTSRV